MAAAGTLHAPLISVRSVTFSYGTGTALEAVSLNVAPGDRIAIIGPNGAGKSTLLKAIMGLITPDRGAITVVGDRRRLGYVAQHEEVDWNFPISVLDAVLMGMWREVGWFRRAGRAQNAKALAALDRVGLAELGQRQVGELSGGQRRRVFIARALAQQADVLLLDEPFSGVDIAAEADLLAVLRRLNDEGITLLLSTHDLELAREQFDKVLALRRKVIAFGQPREVFTREHLTQLYGKRIIAYENGAPAEIFVDEHGCEDHEGHQHL
ncbi:MAG: metal ABC transporter ATP-binding protein [Anaerolineae bacterium]|nr:metal ABC transporter ATP-binding protein [Anaerolineae bacterium]